MWDDNIVIGKGIKMCTATRIFAIEGNHSISENSQSYWISNAFLGLGMIIFKNTEEG